MNDDLISRKAVVEAVDRHTKEDGTLDDDISVILEEVKTALDKEKVMKELHRKQSEALKMRDDENISCTAKLKSFWHSRLEAYTLAIEIVKKGGIER